MSAPNSRSTIDRDAIFTTDATEGSVEYRVRAVRDPEGDSVFITALPLNDVESTVTRLTRVAADRHRIDSGGARVW